MHLLVGELDAWQGSEVEPEVRGREGCLRQVSGAMSAQNRHAQKCPKGVAPGVISRTIQASEELPRVGGSSLEGSPHSVPVQSIILRQGSAGP